MTTKYKYKDKILKLRAEGKTYNEISKELGCSKGLISFHCGEGQKEKMNMRQTERRKNIVHGKIERFRVSLKDLHRIKNKTRKFVEPDGTKRPLFTFKDLKRKFGESPRCYLTGRKLDWAVADNISLDHIVPRSKGDSCEIENCGLTCPEVNRSKTDLTLEEYFSLCKEVLEHNGYKVEKLVGHDGNSPSSIG